MPLITLCFTEDAVTMSGKEGAGGVPHPPTTTTKSDHLGPVKLNCFNSELRILKFVLKLNPDPIRFTRLRYIPILKEMFQKVVFRKKLLL